MTKFTLYSIDSETLKVDITAYFNANKFIISGYDCGKTVKGILGSYDYEYSITVPPDEVLKLYTVLEVQEGDQIALLKKIASLFNANNCFSKFNDFLKDNNIKSEHFFWRD